MLNNNAARSNVALNASIRDSIQYYRLSNIINQGITFLSSGGLTSFLLTHPVLSMSTVSLVVGAGVWLYDSSFLTQILQHQNNLGFSNFIQLISSSTTVTDVSVTSPSELTEILSQPSASDNVGDILNRADRSYLFFRKVLEAIVKYWYNNNN
jgi:hypothetical protein